MQRSHHASITLTIPYLLNNPRPCTFILSCKYKGLIENIYARPIEFKTKQEEQLHKDLEKLEEVSVGK